MSDLADVSPSLFLGVVLALVISISLNFWLYGKPKSGGDGDDTHAQYEELPSEWWTSTSRFETERRAIFSQTWICVSHRGRFVKPGDYVTHEVAGFRVFLILGKDNTVRTFHNVCRHRAFPVTKKASGSATILGCGYHGWSYNTRGELTKAPYFDNVPGFDRSENSLMEIQTKMDGSGFLHINLNSSKEANKNSSPPDAKRIGKPSRISQASRFLDSWEWKGNFNWKILVNDNEDGVSSMSQLRFGLLTTVYTKRGSPFWLQVTYSPDTVKQTAVRCDVYSAKNQSNISFDDATKQAWEGQLRAKVQEYEQTYALAADRNSNFDGRSSAQTKIAHLVNDHLGQEKTKGVEIKPASVQSCKSAAFMKAEELCQAAECAGSSKLEW